VEVGWSGRSTMVGAWAAADTPCAERTPATLRLGEAEIEQGCTVEVSIGFLGAGVGTGSGVARRGHAGPSAGVCSSIARVGRTRVRFFLPEF
jgi:hypothetical protein